MAKTLYGQCEMDGCITMMVELVKEGI